MDFVLCGETLRVSGLALVHFGGDGFEAVTNGSIRLSLEVTAGLDRGCILLKGFLDRLGVSERLGEGGDLVALLSGEREPVLDLGLELGLVGESDGGVEKGRRGGDNDTVGTESVNGLLGNLLGRSQVVLPDVAARDETEGEGELRVLQGGKDRLELSRGTVKIDVKSVNGQLGNELDVGLETAEVSGKSDLEARGGLGESLVSLGEDVTELVSGIEHKTGLIDLNLFGTSGLELLEEFSKGGSELVNDVDGLEVLVGLITASLADEKVGDGTENDGASLDAGLLGLGVLVDVLGVDELEVGLGRDLTLQVCVQEKDRKTL